MLTAAERNRQLQLELSKITDPELVGDTEVINTGHNINLNQNCASFFRFASSLSNAKSTDLMQQIPRQTSVTNLFKQDRSAD